MTAPAADVGPLLERERELAALTRFVDATTAGCGGVLWVQGPAGIGKTRLLRAVREHAERTGARVLWARAAGLERDVAYGVVRALFERMVTARPTLLSSGPATLAAPVVTVVTTPSTPGLLAAERWHGLYWLTVALADDGPLVLVVDDAQWADDPSLLALGYLARRVEELPVGIVLAGRPDLPVGPGRAVRDDPATILLQPGPLSRAACHQLIRNALGDPAPAFLTACVEATDGNPLLLAALLAALREDAVAPDEAGIRAVGLRAQAIVAAFVLPRLRHLPPHTAALARAVAVLGAEVELRQAAELAELDPDTAVESADVLVAAALLAPGRPLNFAHPLVADAIVAHMSAAERHRGHLRAARCLASERADPERVAAHLLVVERLADPWVVARLRSAAGAALANGAPAAAVTYLRRAIDEPAPADDLPEILVELGLAQLGTGDGAGFTTLREAWERSVDPTSAGRVALAISRAVRSGGRTYQPAEEIVVAALARLGGTEPELVAELETELALSLRIGSGPGRPSAARVDELAAIASARGDEPTSRLLRLAALDLPHNPSAGPAARALAAEAAVDAARTGLADVGSYYRIYVFLFAIDEMDVVSSTVDATVEAARRSGRLATLAVASTIRARARMRVGRLQEAEQDARLADRIAEGLGAQERRYTLGAVVQCLVERGRIDEADDELTAAGVPMTLASLLMARARLRLAQDRPADALVDLEECGRRQLRRRVRHPNVVPWQPWSAVAMLRLGREQEARERAGEALSRAREFGSARAEGVALWASGLVERSADVLADAVPVLAQVQAPLERARALVDLGAALRRTNRRTAARGPLGEGLQLAHECGAGSLVATARLELAAAGVHLRRPAVSGPDALTPTERRIADMAADGASNRHIAQALFVSPKTVENHLGNAYRKLGVAGRAGLADALARQR